MKKFVTTILFTVLATLGFHMLADATTYTLVTDVNDLAVGDKIVLTNRAHQYAMGAQRANNRGANEWNVKFSPDFSTVSIDNDTVEVITLAAGTKEGTFAFQVADGYLYAASSSSNNLKTQDVIDDNASATIAFYDDEAAIVFQGTNTRNQLKFNYSSTLFSCYSTAQQLVCIYKQGGGEVPTVTSVTVGGAPTKLNYVVGDNFSRTGITATATYSNGQTSDVTSNATWTVSPSKLETAGEVEVTVKAVFQNVEGSGKFTVTVAAPAVADSLYIDGTPARLSYYVGNEFSTSGLKVKAHYTDGTTKEVTSKAAWEVTPATFTAAGTVEVTVKATVDDLVATAQYSATVTEAPLSSDKKFEKITSTDGLKATAHYIILSADGDYAASVVDNKKISTVKAGETTYAIGEDGVVTVPVGSAVEVYTLDLNDDNNWTLADSNGNVASNGSSSTNITNGTGAFYITFDNDGNAVIAGTTAGTRVWLLNTSTNVIGNYAGTNAGTAGYAYLALYKEVAAPAPSFKKGDVNGDGTVDVDDINCLIKVVLGQIDASVYNGRADVNNDNTVDVDDINAIIRIVLGH